MLRYAAAIQDRLVHRRAERTHPPETPTRWRKEWEGRAERYQVRQQRKQEDRAWKAAKTHWRHTRQAYQALSRAERRAQKAAFADAKRAWQQHRHQRQVTLENRKQENRAWHHRNQALKTAHSAPADPRVWLAILVVTDNCTRQGLGLPVFRSGAKLTSAEVIAALQALLPPELQFLISDQGTHFRSTGFAQLAEDEDFLHIPIYRHRPETNGIAERYILTLKNWLREKSWDTVTELAAWLAEFLPFYNERPHQGLAIPGLSPNEFAKRIWLM